MTKVRRVGTFTAGIVLVMFGIVFFIRTLMPKVNFSWIISMWPLILIMLGAEVLTAYMKNRNEELQYDFAAILLVIMLSFFAMGMGGVELLISHAPEHIHF